MPVLLSLRVISQFFSEHRLSSLCNSAISVVIKFLNTEITELHREERICGVNIISSGCLSLPFSKE
jgi:hypothetical protein